VDGFLFEADLDERFCELLGGDVGRKLDVFGQPILDY
jgi:hypothetical protein